MGIASRCSVAFLLLAAVGITVEVRTWEADHDKRGIRRFGIPLEGNSFPYHNWDWKRGLFFRRHPGSVLIYDTNERRLLYGGSPPNGIV